MPELASSWLAARQRMASASARVEQIVKTIGWTLNVEDLAVRRATSRRRRGEVKNTPPVF